MFATTSRPRGARRPAIALAHDLCQVNGFCTVTPAKFIPGCKSFSHIETSYSTAYAERTAGDPAALPTRNGRGFRAVTGFRVRRKRLVRWSDDRGTGRTLLALCVLVLSGARYAGAQEGLYAGVAAGWDRASADYTKGIGLDVPPASYETATNDATGGFGTVRASLGYRTFVAGRAYVSGEFEAAFHGGSGPAGYLQEGTGVGDRDVWPGPWSVEKNRGFGANAPVGVRAGRAAGRRRIGLFRHRRPLVGCDRAARHRRRRGVRPGRELITRCGRGSPVPRRGAGGAPGRTRRPGLEVVRLPPRPSWEFRTGGDGVGVRDAAHRPHVRPARGQRSGGLHTARSARERPRPGGLISCQKPGRRTAQPDQPTASRPMLPYHGV